MDKGRVVLHLPKQDGTSKSIECDGSVVFIGANGSGKTRLGAWIELNSPENEKVHRISAQKSLSMPDTTTPTSIELAENDLIWGNTEHRNNKNAFKWNRKPATKLLNDFEKLMVYLFSDETEQNARYKARARESRARIDPPHTKMDKLKTLWEKILPHRELIIGGLRIQTQVKGSRDEPYQASEMSDGERVIFYLIGQCLAAPDNGVILIDEPELHLHKSIQLPLWSEVEELRSDCLFVYLTHNIEFAAAKDDSFKIWLKSFDGKSWDWEPIQYDDEIPEALLIEVLGSRKPVIFVEGEDGSFDVSLYREILANYLVVPCGGCENVIRCTKAMRANTQLTHLNAFGIVDRDRRVPEEISALESHGIYVLEVAEVENLFCCEEIVALVSQTLERDVQSDFQAVKSYVIKRLSDELDNQVALHVSSEVRHKLSLFEETNKGEDAISGALKQLYEQIDVSTLYEARKYEFYTAIENGDYLGILRIYNRKKLSGQVSAALGLADGELPELVIRLAKGKQRPEVCSRIKGYFGSFADSIV